MNMMYNTMKSGYTDISQKRRKILILPYYETPVAAMEQLWGFVKFNSHDIKLVYASIYNSLKSKFPYIFLQRITDGSKLSYRILAIVYNFTKLRHGC